MLERIYVEGAQASARRSHRRRARAPAPGRAGARSRQGGSARARLSAARPAAIAFVLGELVEGRMPDLTSKVKFG